MAEAEHHVCGRCSRPLQGTLWCGSKTHRPAQPQGELLQAGLAQSPQTGQLPSQRRAAAADAIPCGPSVICQQDMTPVLENVQAFLMCKQESLLWWAPMIARPRNSARQPWWTGF